MCDYYVRGSAQQEETLKGKGWALRKMRNADEDEAQLQKLDEEQEALRKRYWHQDIVLGEVVAAGVAVGGARDASLLPDETWESGTASLGADAA
ncbi:hypothetical protein N7455_004322 [Penicillium solitum]|uniref:uncharacterized protein n=1 Tax=Penicillium solitum TaxID=60172 RepID=UPI0032C4116A|nr:hypothetical protein N7455_004322 [Penicillium solitum]